MLDDGNAGGEEQCVCGSLTVGGVVDVQRVDADQYCVMGSAPLLNLMVASNDARYSVTGAPFGMRVKAKSCCPLLSRHFCGHGWRSCHPHYPSPSARQPRDIRSCRRQDRAPRARRETGHAFVVSRLRGLSQLRTEAGGEAPHGEQRTHMTLTECTLGWMPGLSHRKVRHLRWPDVRIRYGP
jgi:hypothetical protein